MQSIVYGSIPPSVNRLTRYKPGTLCHVCKNGAVVFSDFRLACNYCKVILAETIFAVQFHRLPIGQKFYLPGIGVKRCFVKGAPKDLLDHTSIDQMVSDGLLVTTDMFYCNAMAIDEVGPLGEPIWQAVGSNASTVPVEMAMIADRFGVN